jgi:hypothetical protein
VNRMGGGAAHRAGDQREGARPRACLDVWTALRLSNLGFLLRPRHDPGAQPLSSVRWRFARRSWAPSIPVTALQHLTTLSLHDSALRILLTERIGTESQYLQNCPYWKMCTFVRLRPREQGTVRSITEAPTMTGPIAHNRPSLRVENSTKSEPATPAPRLRRKLAARYITEHWGIPLTSATLAKLACVGGGPRFRKAGRTPLYEPADLDEWARAKLSRLVCSTSELHGASHS